MSENEPPHFPRHQRTKLAFVRGKQILILRNVCFSVRTSIAGDLVGFVLLLEPFDREHLHVSILFHARHN